MRPRTAAVKTTLRPRHNQIENRELLGIKFNSSNMNSNFSFTNDTSVKKGVFKAKDFDNKLSNIVKLV